MGKLAYQLKLPELMDMHPVISVVQLTAAKAPDDDPYSRHERAGPVELEDDERHQ